MNTDHDDEKKDRPKPEVQREQTAASPEPRLSDSANPDLSAEERRRRTGSAGGGPYSERDEDDRGWQAADGSAT